MMLDVTSACAYALCRGDVAVEREAFLRGQALCAWSLLAGLTAFAPLWLLLHA